MYLWLWRHLPGPWPLRVLACAVLLGAVVVLLFGYRMLTRARA